MGAERSKIYSRLAGPVTIFFQKFFVVFFVLLVLGGKKTKIILFVLALYPGQLGRGPLFSRFLLADFWVEAGTKNVTIFRVRHGTLRGVGRGAVENLLSTGRPKTEFRLFFDN